MKLLYAYFDFSDARDMREMRETRETHGTRGMREMGLNFSTTERFTIEKVQDKENKEYRYVLSRTEKSTEEQLPNGFWDDPIYNVTAIVGDNGAGKSTLIHQMISVLVSGLKPDIPFLTVFEKTEKQKRKIILYCGKGPLGYMVNFSFPNNENEMIYWSIDEYPSDLKQTKTLLIDNTLSASSMDLYDQYSKEQYRIMSSMEEHAYLSECQFQFYNKSLFASICHSNAASAVGRSNKLAYTAEALGVHFRYETYQELRVLFDKWNWKILQDLKGEGIPVPNPKKVIVTVEGVHSLQEDYFPENKIDWAAVRHGKAGFTERFCVCMLISIFDQMLLSLNMKADKWEHTSLDKEFRSLFSDRNKVGFQIKDIIRVLEQWRDGYERGFFQQECQDAIEKVLDMTVFLEKNKHLLDGMFRLSGIDERKSRDYTVSYDESILYEIDIEETIRNNDRRNCMIDFLIKYRAISDRVYFLSFSAGLSSGEKNILRMLTQIRYVLIPQSDDDQNALADDIQKENKLNILQNVFGQEDVKTCRTLYLFLDEADLTYHPDWQRLFVFVLTKYLPRLFGNPDEKTDNSKYDYDIDIQIFLATHSPLLLSNIPIQSCIFLKSKTEQGEDVHTTKVVEAPIQQTFGANIHDLLNNAFFLQRTIGEYAYSRFCEIFKDLKELEQKLSNLKQLEQDIEQDTEALTLRKQCEPYKEIIALIGDPIIHTKMSDLYKKCFPPEPTITETLSTISQMKTLGRKMNAQQKKSMIEELSKAIDELKQ